MKISIVTAVYNGATTIRDALDTVRRQTHPDIEHIVVDGGSTDGTQEIVAKHGVRVAQFVSERDGGIYDAMNKGAARATGEVIGFLNSDDLLASESVIASVARTLNQSPASGCYADLVYTGRDDVGRVIRYWQSKSYREGLIKRGWMPPHPTLYVRTEVFRQLGGFNVKYALAADFDFCVRLFTLPGQPPVHVSGVWVRMRLGGASNKTIRNVIRQNLEARDACLSAGIDIGPMFIPMKLFSRLPQFFLRQRQV